MNARVIRVAVVTGPDAACHPRLDETSLEIVAQVQLVGDLLRAPSHEHDVALVGCTAGQLTDPRFEGQLARLARSTATVLIAPHLTRAAALVAGRARVLGLASRNDPPDHLMRVVRAAAAGRISYPPEAIVALLRVLPRSTTRRATAGSTT